MRLRLFGHCRGGLPDVFVRPLRSPESPALLWPYPHAIGAGHRFSAPFFPLTRSPPSAILPHHDVFTARGGARTYSLLHSPFGPFLSTSSTSSTSSTTSTRSTDSSASTCLSSRLNHPGTAHPGRSGEFLATVGKSSPLSPRATHGRPGNPDCQKVMRIKKIAGAVTENEKSRVRCGTEFAVWQGTLDCPAPRYPEV